MNHKPDKYEIRHKNILIQDQFTLIRSDPDAH